MKSKVSQYVFPYLTLRFLCPLWVTWLHFQNAFKENSKEQKKINIKFWLRCEANVRKINVVCRVWGWTFPIPFHSIPLNPPKKASKNEWSFKKNRYKIYLPKNPSSSVEQGVWSRFDDSWNASIFFVDIFFQTSSILLITDLDWFKTAVSFAVTRHLLTV